MKNRPNRARQNPTLANHNPQAESAPAPDSGAWLKELWHANKARSALLRHAGRDVSEEELANVMLAHEQIGIPTFNLMKAFAFAHRTGRTSAEAAN